MKSAPKKNYEKLLIYSGVMLAYFILSLAITYPLISSFGHRIILGGADVYQVLGKINNQALIIDENGFIQSIPILIKSQIIGLITAYAVMKMAVGLFPAYNLFLITSLVLSGFGAYCLAFHFTKNHKASFVAGLIYSFAPFHLLHSASGHLGSSHIEWIPFFALFLFRYLDRYKISDLLYLLLFIILIALSEHHYFAFSGFFILLVLIYKLFSDRDNTNERKKLIIVSVVILVFYLVLISIFYHQYLSRSLENNNTLSVDIDQARLYSMPLVDPIVPSNSSTLWPSIHENFINGLENITRVKLSGIGESGSSGFIGYTTILLSAYLIFVLFKNKDFELFGRKTMADILFWFASGFIFFIFSIGPVIEIGGRRYSLPYRLIFEYVPFMNSIRVCDRWFIFSIMSFAVIAAFSVKYLIYDKKKVLQWMIFITISACITIEFLLVPFKTSAVDYSQWYDQLSKETGKFKVLEIPSSTNYDYGSYQRYICSIHKKACVGGIVTTGRKIANQFVFEENTPIVRKLLYFLPRNRNEADDIVNQDYDLLARNILKFYDIRYIVVSKNYLSPVRQDSIKSYIETNISPMPIYSDKFIYVYDTGEEKSIGGIYINRLIDEGQNNWEKSQTSISGIASRKLNQGDALEVVNMYENPKKVMLKWSEKSKYPLSVRFETDFGEAYSFICGPILTGHEWQFLLPPGIHKIKFSYDKQGEHAISVSEVSITSID
jgi:hypothetical protein